MSPRNVLSAIFLAVVGLVQPVIADAVEVTVTGTLEFSQISAPPLGEAQSGDTATLSFKLDSDDFVDSMNFPTRGYTMDLASFQLIIGTATVGIQNPFPPGETPYFVLRNNDPAVDGFFTATNVDFPLPGVPLDQAGIFENFANAFSVTYTGDTLSSLDILDALGTYDFTGLQVFNWSITDGPFDAAFIIFEEMTIAEAPECFLVFGDGPGDDFFSQGGFIFDTALSDIDASFPVLMDDYPVFTLPGGPLTMGHAGAVGGSGSTAQGPSWPDFVNADGTFAVQIMMWNPYDVPEDPEQYSQGLKCWIAPDGTVHARPFGDGTIDIQLVTGVNAEGETVFSFPFGIPGF